MEKIVCVGLALFSVVLAAFLFNVGYSVMPETGFYIKSWFNDAELIEVSRYLHASAIVSLACGLIAVVAIFLTSHRIKLVAACMFLQTVSLCISWVKYSYVHYPVS